MHQTLALGSPLRARFRGGSKHSEIIAEVRARVRAPGCIFLGERTHNRRQILNLP